MLLKVVAEAARVPVLAEGASSKVRQPIRNYNVWDSWYVTILYCDPTAGKHVRRVSKDFGRLLQAPLPEHRRLDGRRFLLNLIAISVGSLVGNSSLGKTISSVSAPMCRGRGPSEGLPKRGGARRYIQGIITELLILTRPSHYKFLFY